MSDEEHKRKFDPAHVLVGERAVWQEMRNRIARATDQGYHGVLRVTPDCMAWVTRGDSDINPHEVVGVYMTVSGECRKDNDRPDVIIRDMREAVNQHLVDLGVLPESARMASVPARYWRHA